MKHDAFGICIGGPVKAREVEMHARLNHSLHRKLLPMHSVTQIMASIRPDRAIQLQAAVSRLTGSGGSVYMGSKEYSCCELLQTCHFQQVTMILMAG